MTVPSQMMALDESLQIGQVKLSVVLMLSSRAKAFMLIEEEACRLCLAKGML